MNKEMMVKNLDRCCKLDRDLDIVIQFKNPNKETLSKVTELKHRLKKIKEKVDKSEGISDFSEIITESLGLMASQAELIKDIL